MNESVRIDVGVAVSRSGSVISTVVSPHIADMYSKRCALFSESRCGVVCHWDVPAETSVLSRISPSLTFHSGLSFSHSARTLSLSFTLCLSTSLCVSRSRSAFPSLTLRRPSQHAIKLPRRWTAAAARRADDRSPWKRHHSSYHQTASSSPTPSSSFSGRAGTARCRTTSPCTAGDSDARAPSSTC